MSNIALLANTSGTGTFTIAAPNSSTNRRLTLPDVAGTVLASDSIIMGNTTPLAIKTTNTLGATFTGTTAGEGIEVAQTNYTSGNYVSLLEGKYTANYASPHVRIGAMYDGSGSHLLMGTSSSYGSGITQVGMEIDEDGRVTKPNQPGFFAYSPTGAQTSDITFGATYYNIGSHFNAGTGVFTAPIDGRYLFTFAFLHSANPTTYARVLFNLNGANSTTYGDTLQSDSTYVATAMCQVFNLSANDTMKLYNEGNEVYGTSYGGFSGILISQDKKMADYTVTLTDAEDKSLRYAEASAQDWIDNAVKNRARIAKEEIIAKLVAHCNANSIALAVGEDAQITQAFDLGVVQYLADVPSPSLPE